MFDVYEGKGIDPDKKSIAIAVTLQPREKTMTDEEIEALAAKIVAEVQKRTGGVLRGDLVHPRHGQCRVTPPANPHRQTLALDRLADRTGIRRDSIGPAATNE